MYCSASGCSVSSLPVFAGRFFPPKVVIFCVLRDMSLLLDCNVVQRESLWGVLLALSLVVFSLCLFIVASFVQGVVGGDSYSCEL